MSEALERITDAYSRDMREILTVKPVSNVVELLAQHASSDPEFLCLLCRTWVRQLEQTPDVPFETELASFLLELLTLPANMSVVSMRGSNGAGAGVTRGGVVYDWYLFGLERPRFKVPSELLRCNWVMLTCLHRLMYQGQPWAGRPVFGKPTAAADRSEVVLDEFQLPDMFSAHFDRTVLVVFFAQFLCSLAYAIGVRHNDMDYVGVVRQLLQSALKRVETRLLALARPPEWLDAAAMARLHCVVALCASRETFEPARFLQLYIRFIHERQQQQSQTTLYSNSVARELSTVGDLSSNFTGGQFIKVDVDVGLNPSGVGVN